MPRANWSVLKEYPVPSPPSDNLEQFNSFIEDSVEEIQNLILKSRNLRRIRDLLLPVLKRVAGVVGCLIGEFPITKIQAPSAIH